MGRLTDNLNINKCGEAGGGGGAGKMRTVTSNNPLSLIMGVPNKTSLHHLDIVDTGAAITLSKIRKINQSNFTITQPRII